MKTGRKTRRIPGPVYDFIRQKAKLGWSASQILKALEEQVRLVSEGQGTPEGPDAVASLPTIREIIGETRRPGSAWRPDDADGFALEVLRIVVERSRESEAGGRLAAFTQQEVDRIVAIHGCASDLSAGSVYWLAQEYLDRDEDEDVDDLNLSLAFAARPEDRVFLHVATHFAHWPDRRLIALCGSQAVMNHYYQTIHDLTGLEPEVMADDQDWIAWFGVKKEGGRK